MDWNKRSPLSNNGEQRRGRQVADEAPIQVHRFPSGVSARIVQKLGLDPSFISAFSGSRHSMSPFVRYVLPLAATVAVLVACHAFPGFVGSTTLYILLFPAIAYSALCCGIRPSTLAVAVAIMGAKYWFIPPIHSFRVPAIAQSISILAFVFASTTVVIIGEARRRHNQQLQNGQAELEARVKERTRELDTANKGLRELSARLLQLQDEERRRIARELHDSVGQLLVGLTMNLSAARADIDRLSKTATALTDSEALVQEMSKEVRTISHLFIRPCSMK